MAGGGVGWGRWARESALCLFATVAGDGGVRGESGGVGVVGLSTDTGAQERVFIHTQRHS